MPVPLEEILCMRKRLFILLVSVVAVLSGAAQTTITGTVVDGSFDLGFINL